MPIRGKHNGVVSVYLYVGSPSRPLSSTWSFSFGPSWFGSKPDYDPGYKASVFSYPRADTEKGARISAWVARTPPGLGAGFGEESGVGLGGESGGGRGGGGGGEHGITAALEAARLRPVSGTETSLSTLRFGPALGKSELEREREAAWEALARRGGMGTGTGMGERGQVRAARETVADMPRPAIVRMLTRTP